MKLLNKISILIVAALLLAGCTTADKNVRLSSEFWKTTNHKITVAKTKFKNKPGLMKTGQQGLGDLAISSLVTKQVNNHLKKTDLNWYYKELPKKLVEQLKLRKIAANIYPDNLTQKQRKNAIAINMDGDKILILELEALGATRNYYSFIPTGAPKAYCAIKGELIDRTNKKVLWRHMANIEEDVQGKWDQPPSYPNLTAALNLAIQAAQDEIINSFFSGH